MSEKMPVDITVEGNLGTVSFAEEVVAVIAGLAVNEVPGVVNLSGNVASNITSGINEMLGRKTFAKGIRVDVDGHDVAVEASVVLESGYKIPQVGRAIQDNVKKTIETMTGLNVTKVDVHVSAVRFADEIENAKKEKAAK